MRMTNQRRTDWRTKDWRERTREMEDLHSFIYIQKYSDNLQCSTSFWNCSDCSLHEIQGSIWLKVTFPTVFTIWLPYIATLPLAMHSKVGSCSSRHDRNHLWPCSVTIVSHFHIQKGILSLLDVPSCSFPFHIWLQLKFSIHLWD